MPQLAVLPFRATWTTPESSELTQLCREEWKRMPVLECLFCLCVSRASNKALRGFSSGALKDFEVCFFLFLAYLEKSVLLPGYSIL